MVSLVQSYAPMIAGEARAGRDAYAWGFYLAERTPPEWRPALERVIGCTPLDRQQLLAQVAPALLPYESWIERAVSGAADALGFGDDDEDGGGNGASVSQGPAAGAVPTGPAAGG